MTTMAMIIQIELRKETQNVVSFIRRAQLESPAHVGGLMPR